jgi:hypothetical protein
MWWFAKSIGDFRARAFLLWKTSKTGRFCVHQRTPVTRNITALHTFVSFIYWIVTAPVLGLVFSRQTRSNISVFNVPGARASSERKIIHFVLLVLDGASNPLIRLKFSRPQLLTGNAVGAGDRPELR